MARKKWDDYWIGIAEFASDRATCIRLKVGCVLVKDNRGIATGYNGSIPGFEHCEESGCIMINNHCKRCNHAEVNAIIQCAKNGVSCEGTTAYVTHRPCVDCCRLLISSGVKRIVYKHGYGKDQDLFDYFTKNVEVVQYEGDI